MTSAKFHIFGQPPSYGKLSKLLLSLCGTQPYVDVIRESSLVVLLAGVCDGLELEGGEVPLVDDVPRHLQLVPDVGRLHGGHRGRLHHGVGVRLANLGEKLYSSLPH